ncbi:hypothetical protein ABE28_005315 [Peribacillus muralis]|uniref:Uncharacterized protein n=1 Tax=Peribacillus muralis TaxID=264697 RepID=A0A1B3XKL8_9BACI|nr:hypothetical protein [Peribacillus muralis]AOH53760.1 hypothetical protein ABE28_005315 [Peribacillus muralis]
MISFIGHISYRFALAMAMMAVTGKELQIAGSPFPFAVLTDGYQFHDSSLLHKYCFPLTV